jgi:predicted glycogen debranching enzyme
MTGFDPAAEWLEADGHGGFAMGAADLVRTRRYHALLLCAATPPTGRMVLVNGLEVWIDSGAASYALSSQHYTPDVIWPDGARRVVGFVVDPWPTWTYLLPNGIRLTQEVLVSRQTCETIVRWRLDDGAQPVRLRARPLMSGRDYHALHHENPAFNFAGEASGQTIRFRPYASVPSVAVSANGVYRADPLWYRNFLYSEELARGLDAVEDLASPGEIAFELEPGRPAVLIFGAQEAPAVDARAHAETLIAAERVRRASFVDPLARSAQSYFVRRGNGRTIFAGYPWFTDWGRDTFISLRGLALAVGDGDGAEQILATWAPFVSEGMTPNLFPDGGGAPEYNSVDASLWYIVAAHDIFAAREAAGRGRDAGAAAIQAACEAILEGYAHGARFNIGADSDGLLKAGAPGFALTWMDARVGGRPVTGRIGKPVEVQALWINALQASFAWSDRWRPLAAQAARSFAERFPNPAGGLYDVVDADHVGGRVEAKVRPNQIFAVGGLPFPLLQGDAARGVVDCVERALLTPFGLRTLSPEDPAYVGAYRGGPAERDAGYHQGAAWPWLMGAFVDAWLRVRGGSDAAKAEARVRFLAPLVGHLNQAGLDHVSELVDGDAPHRPGGCPFQAWSLGELIRIERMLRPQA